MSVAPQSANRPDPLAKHYDRAVRCDHTVSSLDWRLSPSELAARWPADTPLLWLHSGRVHKRWARWSIMASPHFVYRFNGRSHLDGELGPELADVRLTHDPLRDLDAILAATSLDPHELDRADQPLPFRGGWIGCFSYDLGREIEPRAQHHFREGAGAAKAAGAAGAAGTFVGGWPLIELARCPDALVFDHVSQKWHSIESRAHDAQSRVATRPWLNERFDADSMRPGSRSDATSARSESRDGFHLGDVTACIAPEAYESMVARTIEYIAAGDIFQANIAQRFRAAFDGSSRALAIDAFERAAPWYGAYLELGSPDSPKRIGRSHACSRALLSLSPELFLHTNPLTRRVITRPIKGTRPASREPEELRDSLKDQAELYMIVDLMRNDLGRVCEYGSVRVPQPRIIESHPTVHHGVAEIAGRLRQNIRVSDVLRATFPPGSVTGAPKIRAMQIIDELEAPHARGPYCGAIGFISDCGAVTLNVAIRTMLLEGEREPDRWDRLADGALSYSAGAGIVADSVAEHEQQETLDKAAVVRALTQHVRAVAR